MIQSSQSIQQPLPSRAISLFRKISETRSCADAYIETHWCSCLNWRQINSTTEEDVVRAANAVIDTINSFTKQYRSLCETFNLTEIMWVAKLKAANGLVRFKGNIDADGYVGAFSDNSLLKANNEIYQLKIVVRPGGAIYEASVVHHILENNFKAKISDISRVNQYGSQAKCILDLNPELRKFCYCK